jgi:hypothetical protein
MQRNVAIPWVLMVIIGAALLSPRLFGQPQITWGDADARLTKSEFIEMYYLSTKHEHEKSTSLNSYNVIQFIPSSSPEKALLYVTQTYNVKGHTTEEAELRRGIREIAKLEVDGFESSVGLPIIQKRWKVVSPRKAFVIRHVRADDIRDILAVTLDGETFFEKEDFKRAEALVKSRGGLWSW